MCHLLFYSNNEEEEENFKVEKDQLIQAVAQSFNSPKPNKPVTNFQKALLNLIQRNYIFFKCIVLVFPVH